MVRSLYRRTCVRLDKAKTRKLGQNQFCLLSTLFQKEKTLVTSPHDWKEGTATKQRACRNPFNDVT
jgi:hypothetical protein